MPAGLSMTSQPWIGSPRRLRAIVVLVAPGFLLALVPPRREVARHRRVVQQRLDARGGVEGPVGGEADRWGIAQLDLVNDLAAEIAAGAVERLHHLRG